MAGKMLSLMGQYSQLLSFGALNDEPLIVDYKDLMFKEASVTGFWAAQEIERLSDTEKAEMMNELMYLVTTNQLQLPVHKVFTLKDYAHAFAAHEDSSSLGKIMFKGSNAY